VVGEDGRVAVPEVAAELFQCRGDAGFAESVEVEAALGRQRCCHVFVLVAYVRG
jgi:hypothetical protein